MSPQVWVTASTSAGEGQASPRVNTILRASPNAAPVALGASSTQHVPVGASLSLPCRAHGGPEPQWTLDGSPVEYSGK